MRFVIGWMPAMADVVYSQKCAAKLLNHSTCWRTLAWLRHSRIAHIDWWSQPLMEPICRWTVAASSIRLGSVAHLTDDELAEWIGAHNMAVTETWRYGKIDEQFILNRSFSIAVSMVPTIFARIEVADLEECGLTPCVCWQYANIAEDELVLCVSTIPRWTAHQFVSTTLLLVSQTPAKSLLVRCCFNAAIAFR